MRHRHCCHIVVLGTLLLSCGCYPAVATRMPRITGRVIDDRGNPVRGAEITVARGAVVDPAKSKSREDGRFRRPARTEWHMVPVVFPNLAGPRFTCAASLDARESVARSYGKPTTQVRFMGLGRVDSIDVGDLVIPAASGR